MASMLSLVLLNLSCSSQYYTDTVRVEVRYPSPSGLTLEGRSMGVVYTYTDVPEDSLFSANLAEGFVSEMEKMYFGGQTLLDIYSVKKNPAGNYGQLDTLVRLVMDTNCDVVFLIDCERGEETEDAEDSYPLAMGLYAYDSLDPKDSGVKFYKGSVNAVTDDQAAALGERAASKFRADWRTEAYSIYYFDTEEWWQAFLDAADMKWAVALKKWIGLANTNNLQKRSCAEYNAAVACYMLSDFELEKKWLDMSDMDDKRPLSDGLRKRILARSGAN
ncbi:MAG: hypothetical protein MJY56_06310 [Bacteroidales bacterium]|nr:hypothetical protein [Bacteroidales bacterium]